MQPDQTQLQQFTIIGIEEERQRSNFFTSTATSLNHIFRLFRYRELIRNFVIRDLKVRYKNSVLGIVWSLMNPLLMMVVFTLVFTVMAPIRAGEISSFPVFVLCALLPWNFFASSIMGCTMIIVANAPLLKKVYFPPETLPLSLVLANLVNFLISIIVLFVMILIFQTPLTVWLIYLPLIIFTQIVFTLGIGFFLATINVFYRDTQQVMDVLMLAWFFVTPILWPINILPRNYEFFGYPIDVWRLIPIINPMASLISNYRDVLYFGVPPGPDFLARTAITAIVIFIIGWFVFQRYSWRFAEEL